MTVAAQGVETPQPNNQFLHKSPLQMPIRALHPWSAGIGPKRCRTFRYLLAELRKLNQFRTFARGFDNAARGMNWMSRHKLVKKIQPRAG